MLEVLPFGSTRPSGWIAARMRRDLDGFVGHLDRLVPDLIVDDDVYGRGRLMAGAAVKDLGAVTEVDLEHPEQFLWWNSETQSNWRDGWVRHVLLVGDAAQRAAVRGYVERMVATADADGYLGIYAPDLRFPMRGENGELWAQATLGRALLGYVEAAEDRTHAEVVLEAVVRAMRVTMAAWPAEGSNPFPARSYAGVAHGLMVVDVLDRLSDLTGDEAFRVYAAWLFRAYCEGDPSEPDARLDRLADPNAGFIGHGVHTYEHLRALVIAGQVEPTPQLAEGLAEYLRRMRACLTPAHGPIGDEWIAGRTADATTTGYELCSTQELLDSLIRLVAATGDLFRADDAEAVALNAGLGAWHPTLSAVAYLQTDNALAMTGNRPDLPQDPYQTRYRYSPVHRQAAVCCVPNAGRLLPTYLRGAVMLARGDVVVALFGPMCTVLDLDGASVLVEQRTEYPDELAVDLVVTSSPARSFGLVLRVPAWASGVDVDVEATRGEDQRGHGLAMVHTADRIELRGTWSKHRVRIRFAAAPSIGRDTRGEGFVRWGPRVLALPIPERTTVTNEYGVAGLVDVAVEPASAEHATLRLVDDAGALRVVPGGVEAAFRAEGHPTTVRRTLTPLGTAALRRVTFPLDSP
ncbi:MAG: glycoside hydrolase family 127 protein [Candidatus Nanopelagicales bacterium]|nr:glycoside hydrolase family 127 protein [Candidatus Nanopelagicales bacterium]